MNNGNELLHVSPSLIAESPRVSRVVSSITSPKSARRHSKLTENGMTAKRGVSPVTTGQFFPPWGMSEDEFSSNLAWNFDSVLSEKPEEYLALQQFFLQVALLG